MHTTEQRTLRVIAEISGVTPQLIEMTHTWEGDLQGDSLSCVELAMALEDEFGIDLDQDEFDKLQTVQQIIDFVANVCKPEQVALPMAGQNGSLNALIAAEEFMRSFETNTTHPKKANQIRAAIAEERQRITRINTLLRASMACIMELDAIKSRYIPLHDTGNGRITELVQAGHDACAAMGYPYVAGEESPEDDIEQRRRSGDQVFSNQKEIEPAGEGWAGIDSAVPGTDRAVRFIKF